MKIGDSFDFPEGTYEIVKFVMMKNYERGATLQCAGKEQKRVPIAVLKSMIKEVPNEQL